MKSASSRDKILKPLRMFGHGVMRYEYSLCKWAFDRTELLITILIPAVFRFYTIWQEHGK